MEDMTDMQEDVTAWRRDVTGCVGGRGQTDTARREAKAPIKAQQQNSAS